MNANTHLHLCLCGSNSSPWGVRKMRKKCRNKVANLLFLTHRRKHRQCTGRGVAAVRQLQAATNAPNGVKTTATNETDPFSRYSGQGRCRKRWPKRWWWCKSVRRRLYFFILHTHFFRAKRAEPRQSERFFTSATRAGSDIETCSKDVILPAWDDGGKFMHFSAFVNNRSPLGRRRRRLLCEWMNPLVTVFFLLQKWHYRSESWSCISFASSGKWVALLLKKRKVTIKQDPYLIICYSTPV